MPPRLNSDQQAHVRLVDKVQRLKAAHKALAARVAILEAVHALKKGSHVARRTP
jgi:hypothetical protein